MLHMGNIGSSPTKVWEVTYMSHVADGGRRTHRWVLPQTDEVGMWDTRMGAPTD